MVRINHGPRLGTIRMVENTIKNHDKTILTLANIKKALPKQINHAVLKDIIDYLDKSNKIYVSVRGITWIHNPSPKMQRALAKGTVHLP